MILLRFLLRIVVLAGLCACGKVQEAPAPGEAAAVEKAAAPAGDGGSPAPAAVAAAPEAANPAPAAALELTPELRSAVLGVRVAVASTLQREHTGVLLPAGTLKPGVDGESMRRFAAVLLPAYDEAALRDPACTIKVLRGKFDANGTPFVLQYAGLLVHFDAQSHVGVVQFSEDFPYRLEAGLEPAAGAPPVEAEGLHLLLGAHETQGLTDAPRPNVQKPPPLPGTVLPGTLEVSALPVRLHAGALAADGADAGAVKGAAGRLNAVPVLSEAGRLAGFARRAPGAGAAGWEFVPFTPPEAVAETGVRYTPLSVSLTSRESYAAKKGSFRVTVRGELQDAQGERPLYKVAVRHVPAPELPPPAPEGRHDQPAIEPDTELLPARQQEDGTMTFDLTVPPEVSTEHLLVQVWLVRRQGDVVFHSRPFVVVAQRRGAGFYQHVVGLPGRSDSPPPALAGGTAATPAQATPQGTPAAQMPPVPEPAPVAEAARVELKTESPILYGVPVREGRELLLRLDGAPFWKRLSLAEGKWLPLPEADLSLCHLTGNREALFILDPARRELSRHDAESLRLEQKVLLPEGRQYLGVAAGCLSDDSPVTVLMERTALPCDARTLAPALHALLPQQKDRLPVSGMNCYYLASGDGLMAWGRPLNPKDGEHMRPVFSYDGEPGGYTRMMVPETSPDLRLGRLPTMTAASQWHEGLLRPGMLTGTHQHLFSSWQRPAGGPLACSPCFFVVRSAVSNRDGSQHSPPRCSFFSYYADEPWATLDVPEAGDVPLQEWGSFASRVWLDVQSLTVAVWHHERTITLHTLDRARLPEPGTPVLLNYPDCHVLRGGEFHFKPLLLGGGAQVSAAEMPADMKAAADGTLDWQVPALALPQRAEFSLTVGGGRQAQRPAVVPVSLRLGGMRPAALVPPGLSPASAESALEAAEKPGAKMQLVPLASRLHVSQRPILRVLPGLDDYLALSLEDGTLELLSVKDWKVAGSCRVGDAAAAFMAGDVVFIYSNTTRELTRHALPDFTVTARLRMPRTSRLCALGVGTNAAGPLSLVLTEDIPQPQQPKSPVRLMPQRVNSALILDKQTMAAGKWAAYTPKPPKGMPQEVIQNTLLPMMKLPVLLPTSNDGRLVSLEHGLLVVTPGMTMGLNYSGPPNPNDFMGVRLYFHPQSQDMPVIASPMGGRVFSQGQMYHDNYPVFKIAEHAPFSTASRCGNYCAVHRKESDGTQQMRLYAADDGRALACLAGLDVLRVNDLAGDRNEVLPRRQMMPLGELNKLAVLSRGGLLLQVLELDLAAAYQQLNPEWAYVTSHPFPLVAAGRTLDYQATVSNPAAVDHYELRDQVPGATMDKTGHLTYQAPAALKEPQQVTMAVLVHLKNGERLLHEFPVNVIVPKPTPESPASKPKGGR